MHKEKIGKLAFIKISILCSMKNTTKENTGTLGEKMFVNHISDNVPTSGTYKKHIKLHNSSTHFPIVK